ncbi:MAG: divalent-cation tolerance protein CutA [Terriglobales bacterium]|jgi:periplasmic divalent cation tolerance protein
MTDKKIVLTTTATREDAGKIARALVERRLAACVNVVAIESVYRWKDEVESAEEWLLLIKTTAAAYDHVHAAIKELHTYDLPECVLLPIESGSEEYLAWIGESVHLE